jgi:hypothetical protein
MPSPDGDQYVLFPDLPDIPLIVRRIWVEALAYYDTKTAVPLTQRHISKGLLRRNPELPGSLSTVERAFRTYDDDLLPWPILRGMRPPWESMSVPESTSALSTDSEPVRLQIQDHLLQWEAFDERGDKHTVQAVADKNGLLHLVARRMITMLAAGISAMITLDGLDGHIDAAIHWCRIILAMSAHGAA